MSSAEPTDHEILSEHFAGIIHIQAEDRLSAETTAQPLASQSMGSQEGALGRTEDHYPSGRNESVDASMRRPNSIKLPREQASETVFGLTTGDSSVDSTT
eukprot:6824968-Pyramimonas_sp.AAC.1